MREREELPDSNDEKESRRSLNFQTPK
jgi:hypothetical protein